MNRRPARPLGLALLLAAFACDGPLDPRDRDGPQAAQLFVDVVFSDSAAQFGAAADPRAPGAARGAGALVVVSFNPGSDRDGTRRRVTSDTLRVLDTVLVVRRPAGPSGTAGTVPVGDVPTYPGPTSVAFVPLAPEAFATRPVAVTQAPVVRGLPVLGATAAVFAVGRRGAGDLTLARGSDLVLPLAVPAPPAGGVPSQWNLLVQDDSAFVLSLNGTGRPPAELRVPSELLSAARGRITARLFAGAVAPPPAGSGAPGADYAVTVSVRSQLVWRVRVVAP